MSDILTREQVEQLFQFSPIAELSYKMLAHDAALRAEIAQLKAKEGQ